MGDFEESVDGIVWRYPNPFDIVDQKKQEITEDTNPLFLFIDLVRSNLKEAGNVLFQTEMPSKNDLGFGLTPDDWYLAYVRKVIEKRMRNEGLVHTGRGFQSTTIIDAYSAIYQKRK